MDEWEFWIVWKDTLREPGNVAVHCGGNKATAKTWLQEGAYIWELSKTDI